MPLPFRYKLSAAALFNSISRRNAMYSSDLANVARDLVAGGKGILAADESFSTIKKRFQKLDIESTPQKRRDYREVLFTTPGY
jgi:fructose-bisphosphate aldolase, class I